MLYPLSYGGSGCKDADQTPFLERTFVQLATSRLRLTAKLTA